MESFAIWASSMFLRMGFATAGWQFGVPTGQRCGAWGNNGTTRPVILTGLPANIKEMRVFITDAKRSMQEGMRIPVTSGKTEFTIEKMTFTTLISVQ
jgi:hypothetical protein